MALGLAQMILDVCKDLKNQFYMLNKLCFNNFPKKSIPGDARAQVFQEPVNASHADQGQKSGVPQTFPTLEVKPVPIVPQTWALGHPLQFPRVECCSNIHKDSIEFSLKC